MKIIVTVEQVANYQLLLLKNISNSLINNNINKKTNTSYGNDSTKVIIHRILTFSERRYFKITTTFQY